MYLTKGDVKIVWAAVWAAVNDDDDHLTGLSDAQWARAEELLDQLDSKVTWGDDDEEPPADWIVEDSVPR